MKELTISDVIAETKTLLGAVRGSLIRVAQNLGRIKETYQDEKSWGSFCEEELGISQSFASKLLTVNRVYLVEGGLAPEKIENIDYERLYLARNIEGSAELKAETARTLSRSEIKRNLNDEKPHKGEFGSYCKVCWLSEENHA